MTKSVVLTTIADEACDVMSALVQQQALLWRVRQSAFRCSGIQCVRSLHSSRHVCVQDDRLPPRNILTEADDDDEVDSLVQRQRDALSREPVWSGDERVQDTILRMLVDKHQPLRIKQSNAQQHPADAKLASVQKPNMIGSPSFTSADAHTASIVDVGRVPADEEGRRLAKTPDNKPWRAVYVNPMVSSDGGKPAEPSIYFAKYLGVPKPLPKTPSGKDRLRMAGFKPDSLPLDDRNKMRAIREGVRRWDRAGRMRGVKEEAMQYRRMREGEKEQSAALEPEMPMNDEEVDVMLNAEGVLKEGEEMRLSSASDSKPGEAQVAMSGGRGFTSIANERIEAAMKTSYFRQNSLRGKPLQKDVYASNPYLKGEERIMNRIIQRQGAAPPWVELNVQVESEQSDFRRRLAESWLRRATRIILATSHLRDGLEPIRVTEIDTFESLEANTSLSDGQRRTLNIASSYVDAEWEQREQAYHEASLRDVNNIIRRYNVVAPVSARRGLLVRERELRRVREESRVALVRHLSADVVQPFVVHRRSSGVVGGIAESPSTTTTVAAVAATAGRHSSSGGRDGDAYDGVNESGFDDKTTHRQPRRRSASNIGTLLRRTAQRARELVNW